MTTIERAMSRLTGEPVPEDDDASVNATKVPAEEQRAQAVQAPRLDARAPAPQQDEQGDRHGRTVELDFERLAAAGFLIPGQPANHFVEEIQYVKRRLLGNLVSGIFESDAPVNLVMVTSAAPGEGKTFMTLNLAMSMAMELDRTVLVVDTDVLKSDLSRLLNVARRPGLFDVLSRVDIDIGDVIVRTSVPKLSVIPAGQSREMITEKLASEAMGKLCLELAQRYPDRVILFDSPPVLATTGAVALARFMGQILVVVEAWKTTQETLKQAMALLEGVNVAGFVLNKARQASVASKYYGYGYYHAGAAEQRSV